MRSLANGTFTHEEMDAALRASTGAIGSRFEILDRDLQVVAELDTVVNEKGAVVYEFNAERNIHTTMRMRLRPHEALRGRHLTRLIRAWFQYEMPGRGVAELPMGIYLWSFPERELEPLEEWSVTLGDLCHLMDLGGPGRLGYRLEAGTPVTRALGYVLNQAGISDLSRVSDDISETLPVSLYYSMVLPRDFVDRRGRKVTVENAPVTWLRIAEDLCAAVGFDPLWFDHQGRPVAQPSKDLVAATPDITYRDGKDGIRLSPLRTTVDVSKIANRVFVRSSIPGIYGLTQVGEADANTIAPGHPLSEAVVGTYIDFEYPETIAGSIYAITARARAELYKLLSLTERTSTPSLAYPAHEGFEVAGCQIPGDPELDTMRVFAERGWSFDAFDGAMTHEWSRVYQPTSS